MPSKTFDKQIATITGALGDTTRRGIYVMVREAHDPVTANQIASAFDIHPNVARHHLDKLLNDGFVRISDRQVDTPAAGRPAKRYEVTEKSVNVQYSARKYDRLAELLTKVIAELDDGRALNIAEAVGHDYGVELAAEIGLASDEGFEEAAMAVAQAMMGKGLGASTDPDENRIVAQFCPLCTTGAAQPEIVGRIDHGIVQGLLESAAARPVSLEVAHVHE
ncbi:MAG: helix-turn-helix domain-containing protein [Acidimicrobiia bacterium]|nr:MAG: helix-turn-helix domain-containing protein [Acidimicrobiia bacterium]